MHTRQWLGSFGGRGNGDYRGELRFALQAVTTYLRAWGLPAASGIVRVDGQYGDCAVMADIVASGMHLVVRKRGYRLLEHPRVQAVLTQEPAAPMTTRESQVTYEVFDLPQMLLEDGATAVRLLLTRRAWKRGEPISVGKVVGDWVYEQFVTTLPLEGFLATDVLDLYQGRGAFEGTLADEDLEGDPDRWCSLTPCGQEVWQLVWQWVWNLRLALSAAGTETPLRQIEWALRPRVRSRALPSRLRRKSRKSLSMGRWNGPARTAGAWVPTLLCCKKTGRCAVRKGWSSGCPRPGKRMPLPSDVFLWPRTLTVRPVRCAAPVWDGRREATAVGG